MGDEEKAKEAIRKTDNFQLDKKHTLQVLSHKNFLEILETPDEHVDKTEVYVPLPDISSWLLDETARDQFVVRCDKETEIYWNQGSEDPELMYGGERERSEGKYMTDMMVQWSPHGNFLLTYHKQGVVIWGGSLVEKINKFSHNVSLFFYL